MLGKLYFRIPAKNSFSCVGLDGLFIQLNYKIDEDKTIGRSDLYTLLNIKTFKGKTEQ